MWRNENELVKQAAGGDGEAFRLLIARHYRTFWRLAFWITRNHEDTEDVLQETFLRAFENLRRFRGEAALATWLTRIVVNTALGVVRERERQKSFATLFPRSVDDRNPESLCYLSEVSRIIERTLRTCTPMEVAAFMLRHYDGWPTAQIGREIGVSPDAARQAVYRAANKLRAALEGQVR